MKHTDTRLWLMWPAARTGRWLVHLAVVCALLLAPVLIAQATPAHATHSAAQTNLAGDTATPQIADTGPVAPLCHSGALCVFVGSFALNAGLPDPAAVWAAMPPDSWIWSSWIGAPGAQPPKSV